MGSTIFIWLRTSAIQQTGGGTSPPVTLLGFGERPHRAGLIIAVVVAAAGGGHHGSVFRLLHLVVDAAASFPSLSMSPGVLRSTQVLCRSDL